MKPDKLQEEFTRRNKESYNPAGRGKYNASKKLMNQAECFLKNNAHRTKYLTKNTHSSKHT